MNLRARLTGQTAVVFLLLAGLLAGLQAGLLGNLLIEQTSERMARSIRVAWHALDQRRARLESAVALLSTQAGALGAAPSEAQPILENWGRRWGLDFVDLVDGNGEVVARAGSAIRGDSLELAGLVPGEKSAGVAVMSTSDVAAEGEAFFSRVVASGTADGLVVFAAAPVRGSRFTLVAGSLLNGDDALVDEVEQALFPDRVYRGRKVGTATVFLGRTRVATTVPLESGERAVGTEVSDEVAEQVLGRGEPWTGRARVLGDWYLSRYEPLRNPEGGIVGMLYVGELELLYVDAQRRILLEGVGLVVLAMLLAFLAAWWLGTRLASQVAGLQRATERIAMGDFTVRAPVRGNDEVARLASSFNRMARQLEEDRARIVEQKRAIEAANRNYLEMLGFVSHELRSGLGTAIFNLELVKECSFGELHGEQREGLELVGSSLHYLTDLLNNFLQLSRIERGELLLKKTPVALARDVVRPALAGFETQLRERSMKVEVEIPEDLDVLGDPSLLRVVFENLISNAVKYGRAGGRLVLGARRSDGRVELEVWNEGPGILPDRIPNLFRRFQRYDVDQVGGRRGSGLGLFIVRQIVRQHGGEISVESQPGEWARFRFDVEVSESPGI